MAPFALTNRNIDPTISPVRGPVSNGADLIFLRDTGDWYDKSADGGDVDIPLATMREVDDDLFVLTLSNFAEAFAPAGWTQVQSFTVGGLVGALKLFHRVATDDASDNFHIPVIASSKNRVAQMASFGNIIVPAAPPDVIAQFQGGAIFTTNGSPLTYFSMTAGTDPTETLVIFIAAHLRVSTSGAATTPANTQFDILAGYNLREVGSISTGGSDPDRQNFTWSWDYHDTSVAVPGGAIPYTVQEFGANFSQYSRWHFI